MIQITPRKKEDWMQIGTEVFIDNQLMVIKSMETLIVNGTDHIGVVTCLRKERVTKHHPDDLSEVSENNNMITKSEISALDFDTIEEYYEYIVDSEVNGQLSQAKELYSKLGYGQKEEFMIWFITTFHYDAEDSGESTTDAYNKLLSKLIV